MCGLSVQADSFSVSQPRGNTLNVQILCFTALLAMLTKLESLNSFLRWPWSNYSNSQFPVTYNWKSVVMFLNLNGKKPY